MRADGRRRPSFSLVAFADNAEQARSRVYKNIDNIQFAGMWYRKDI